MVWSSLSPDGSKSVKQNTSPMAANTAYTETTMNNDHFWNIGADEDGHHRAVQMENYVETSIGAPTDPILASGMDGAIYLRELAGSIIPFFRNVNSIMPLLGVRGIAVFNNVAGNVAQTLLYSYNVSSVIRQTTGRFSLNFTTSLPTNNYLILGGAISSVSIDTPCTFSASGITLGNKNANQCIFLAYSGSTANNNILQGWVVCLGG